MIYRKVVEVAERLFKPAIHERVLLDPQGRETKDDGISYAVVEVYTAGGDAGGYVPPSIRRGKRRAARFPIDPREHDVAHAQARATELLLVDLTDELAEVTAPLVQPRTWKESLPRVERLEPRTLQHVGRVVIE